MWCVNDCSMLKVRLCSVVCQLAVSLLPAVGTPSLDLCPLLSQLTTHLWQHHHRSQVVPSQVCKVLDCCFVTPVPASQIVVLSHLWQHHRLFCHTCGSITTVDSWSPSQVSKVSDCCLIYDAFRVFPGQISGKN